MDGDGRLDLLTGSDNCCDREPGFYWFPRTADGRYDARRKVRVKVRGSEELFMARFRAALTDWDGDGRLEVVAALEGTKPGLYTSDGSWSPSGEVTATRPVSGSPEDFCHQPCITDWDGDGLLDLICLSSRSAVVWYRNVDDMGEPRLAGPRLLLRFPEREIAVGLSTGDWDGDGWPDLIVGYLRGESDGSGSISYTIAAVRIYPRQR